MEFVEHKTKNEDKSSVWCHFLVEATGAPNAKCKTCKKVLKTKGGSTKGLLVHMSVSFSLFYKYFLIKSNKKDKLH